MIRPGFAQVAVAAAMVVALGCGKKPVSNPEDYESIGRTFEDAAPGAKPAPAPAPAAGNDLPGVDLSALPERLRKRFHGLADQLGSPCGKAHSLRTSVTSDAACKRAPFAARYVARLLGEDLSDTEVRRLYDARYQGEPRSFQLDGTPRLGADDGRVVLVEFFDYGCPHCAELAPLLDQVMKRYPADVVIYLKNFPLGNSPDSVPAAQAALAAARQGKFAEMHHRLLENQSAQGRSDLIAHARALGLDAARFEKDLADPALQQRVMADRKEGEAAGIGGTPTVFIEGRECAELSMAELTDWIDEALAVNR